MVANDDPVLLYPPDLIFRDDKRFMDPDEQGIREQLLHGLDRTLYNDLAGCSMDNGIILQSLYMGNIRET